MLRAAWVVRAAAALTPLRAAEVGRVALDRREAAAAFAPRAGALVAALAVFRVATAGRVAAALTAGRTGLAARARGAGLAARPAGLADDLVAGFAFLAAAVGLDEVALAAGARDGAGLAALLDARRAAALPGAGGDGLTLAGEGAGAADLGLAAAAWGVAARAAVLSDGVADRDAVADGALPASFTGGAGALATAAGAAGRGAGARRAGAGGGSSRGAGGRGTPRSTATGCAAVDPVVRRTGTGGAGGTGGPSPRPTTPSAVSRQVKATTSLMSAARSNRTIAVWLKTVSTRPREPTG